MNRLAKLTGIVRSLGSRASGPPLRCSFCGKGADEVGRLVAGPSVYICDECVKACVAVIEQHGGFPPSPPAGEDRLTHA